jgi:hypothetical protein
LPPKHVKMIMVEFASNQQVDGCVLLGALKIRSLAEDCTGLQINKLLCSG